MRTTCNFARFPKTLAPLFQGKHHLLSIHPILIGNKLLIIFLSIGFQSSSGYVDKDLPKYWLEIAKIQTDGFRREDLVLVFMLTETDFTVLQRYRNSSVRLAEEFKQQKIEGIRLKCVIMKRGCSSNLCPTGGPTAKADDCT